MACFAVSFQLDNTRDYAPFWQALTQLGAQRAMPDLFLVDLEGATADRMGAFLRQFIEEGDFLFVAQFQSRPYKHRCFKGTESWLDERFPRDPGQQGGT